jgi:predicted oxidoreductase (fatty acid repression mutant protein)
LQHYNPLIDKLVAEQWNVPHTWRLMAQMPFGNPLKTPPAKVQHKALDERRIVFDDIKETV